MSIVTTFLDHVVILSFDSPDSINCHSPNAHIYLIRQTWALIIVDDVCRAVMDDRTPKEYFEVLSIEQEHPFVSFGTLNVKKRIRTRTVKVRIKVRKTPFSICALYDGVHLL